mmetsp:Transcript_31888/g.85274  ORF Transcript_31888/g.85274 Transcript_31888/m.85274 type:complete len:316 (-) Transcript_31888:422-1369(-)
MFSIWKLIVYVFAQCVAPLTKIVHSATCEEPVDQTDAGTHLEKSDEDLPHRKLSNLGFHNSLHEDAVRAPDRSRAVSIVHDVGDLERLRVHVMNVVEVHRILRMRPGVLSVVFVRDSHRDDESLSANIGRAGSILLVQRRLQIYPCQARQIPDRQEVSSVQRVHRAILGVFEPKVALNSFPILECKKTGDSVQRTLLILMRLKVFSHVLLRTVVVVPRGFRCVETHARLSCETMIQEQSEVLNVGHVVVLLRFHDVRMTACLVVVQTVWVGRLYIRGNSCWHQEGGHVHASVDLVDVVLVKIFAPHGIPVVSVIA